MKICVIDIGTNSIHAIFAEIRSTGVFQIIGKEKEMVRLGDESLVTGRLSEPVMTRAIEVLRRLVHLARHRGMAHIIATATSAVRESLNGGEFIDRVREEVKISARIITGKEEGRFIALGVRNTIDFESRKALLIDIGGGSAEFALADQRQTYWIESLRLGANRLRQIMPLSDPPKKIEWRQLEEYLEVALTPVFKKIRETPADFVIGTSGTINSLAKIIKSTDDNVPGQVRLNAKELHARLEELAELKLAERQKIKGLDKDRADMILHGGLVLDVLLKKCGINEFSVCDKALREGILYDYIEKNRKSLKIEEDIPDIRRRGIMTLADRYEPLKAHAMHTSVLALKLFDALSAFLNVGNPADRELLEYASYVHDTGYLIGFHKHHRHAYYLITNAELPGFTEEEVQIVAWVARLHRRRFKKDDEFSKLSPDSQKRVLRLASILRIADALDHSHFGLVHDLKIKVEGEILKVRVIADTDAQWEIHEALQRKDLFEKTFAKKIEFKLKVSEKSDSI